MKSGALLVSTFCILVFLLYSKQLYLSFFGQWSKSLLAFIQLAYQQRIATSGGEQVLSDSMPAAAG